MACPRRSQRCRGPDDDFEDPVSDRADQQRLGTVAGSVHADMISVVPDQVAGALRDGAPVVALLDYIQEHTGRDSVEVNLEIVRGNCRLAAAALSA
jgi:hypothetical protein